MSVFERLMTSVPIDRQAAIVTSQARTKEQEIDLTEQELLAIKSRLKRMHRLMKHLLRLNSPSQHKNFLFKWRNKHPQYRTQGIEPRIVETYVQIGAQIDRMDRAISALKASPEAIKVAREAANFRWAQMSPEDQDATRQKALEEKAERRKLREKL